MTPPDIAIDVSLADELNSYSILMVSLMRFPFSTSKCSR